MLLAPISGWIPTHYFAEDLKLLAWPDLKIHKIEKNLLLAPPNGWIPYYFCHCPDSILYAEQLCRRYQPICLSGSWDTRDW